MSNQFAEKIKCTKCGTEINYDPSEMCLHCWCKSNNLECQCGCQNEEFER